MFKIKYMKLAIDLAEKAKGNCSPNPGVGAVIVSGDEVIGQGYTQAYGQDHAEVQALKNCQKDPKDADLYVTLEPCAHHGKTPPCTDAIISAGIKNVYAGIKDPNPIVNGKGFCVLKQAGINVEYPFCEEKIRNQLEVYLHWITVKKPFIILKNAVSLDGKIAADNGDSKWITNELAREKVHLLRSQVDAVMTTINTVIKDNPTLNVRLAGEHKQPTRIILDPYLSINPDNIICQTANIYKTIIFTSKNHQPVETQYNASLPLEIIPVHSDEDKLDINEILAILAQKKITSLLVEAGTGLNSYLLKNNYVNKLYYFIAPMILGGNMNVFDDLGITDLDSKITFKDAKIETLGDNIVFILTVNAKKK